MDLTSNIWGVIENVSNLGLAKNNVYSSECPDEEQFVLENFRGWTDSI